MRYFWLYSFGPMNYKRHSGTRFKGAVFATSEWSPGFMILEPFYCTVFVAVINNWSIITGYYYKRIFEYSGFFKGFYYFTNRPIELYYCISSVAHIGFSSKSFVRVAWHMYVVCSKIEKEGFITVFLYKSYCMNCDAVCDVFIFP